MKPLKVHSLHEQDKSKAIATLTLAFSSDPIMRWMWPEPCDYLSYFSKLVELEAAASFAPQTSSHLDHYAGVALWLPPGAVMDKRKVSNFLKDTVCKELRGPNFEMVSDDEESYTPKEDHWHLAFLGIDLAHQNEGLGSVLLKHDLKRCDADQKLAFLVSSNPKNVPFYQRHGFEILGTAQKADSPVLTYMQREPR